MIYEYKALIERVIDGDTLIAIVDLGFNLKIKERFRLAEIDTPETYKPKSDKESQHGLLAKKRVIELIEGKEVLLISKSKDKYGRYLADIILLDNKIHLKDILINENLVKLNEY